MKIFLKILFLSFYYPPDLSAGSFRASSLVDALLTELTKNAHVEVITTSPNRYNSFISEAPALEKNANLTIHRVKLPRHQGGMIDQGKAFWAYAKAVLNLSREKNYELVIATSSRLMTAALGAYISRKMCLPLYLDIRDIFTDAMRNILPRVVRWGILPCFLTIENYAISSAGRVNLVSAGFSSYFQERYPRTNFTLYTNGIDEEFLKMKPLDSSKMPVKPLSVVYAGNIGEGQGLHKILPKLAKKFDGKLLFSVIGDGGRRPDLEAALLTEDCKNVEIQSPIKREELIEVYQNADIFFLHLNDYSAFQKVLPSKLFEYAAQGKPIWAGVAGYAAEFIDKNIE